MNGSINRRLHRSSRVRTSFLRSAVTSRVEWTWFCLLLVSGVGYFLLLLHGQLALATAAATAMTTGMMTGSMMFLLMFSALSGFVCLIHGFLAHLTNAIVKVGFGTVVEERIQRLDGVAALARFGQFCRHGFAP